MTATLLAPSRRNLLDRLLDWWTAGATPAKGEGSDTTSRAPDGADLRAALELASVCHVSALSAEYAQHLIDRHAKRMRERG